MVKVEKARKKPANGRNRIHERYACPECGSAETHFIGMSSQRFPKARHRCRNKSCGRDTFTIGAGPRGGDRRSQEFQERPVEEAPPVRRRTRSFSEHRRINRKQFTLLKIFSNADFPQEAWDAAKAYRVSIAKDYQNANVVANYDKDKKHTGAYAVYGIPKPREVMEKTD